MGKTSAEVKQKYNKQHYRQFASNIKFDLYDEIQSYIDAEGISKAKFLERAIQKLTE